MILKDNRTNIIIKVNNTNDTTGLKNDSWCHVKMILDDKELHYEVERESFTKKEFINGLNTIKDFFNSKNKYLEMNFIKNYFKLYLYNNKVKKIDLKLISLVDKNIKLDTIEFKDKDVDNFIELLEDCDIK